MGVGKTTFGKKLANKLQYTFIDLDSLIEEGEKQTITEIFTQKGEVGFRKVEQEYLHNTSNLTNTVISSGGGTPCFFDNMEWMNEEGTTIYLQLSLPILISRLKKHKATRPLISDLDDEKLTNFVISQHKQRHTYYQKANICFDTHQNDNIDLLMLLKEKEKN